MAEILHHLGCINLVNNGINYKPQLVNAGFQPSTVSLLSNNKKQQHQIPGAANLHKTGHPLTVVSSRSLIKLRQLTRWLLNQAT